MEQTPSSGARRRLFMFLFIPLKMIKAVRTRSSCSNSFFSFRSGSHRTVSRRRGAGGRGPRPRRPREMAAPRELGPRRVSTAPWRRAQVTDPVASGSTATALGRLRGQTFSFVPLFILSSAQTIDKPVIWLLMKFRTERHGVTVSGSKMSLGHMLPECLVAGLILCLMHNSPVPADRPSAVPEGEPARPRGSGAITAGCGDGYIRAIK